MTAATQTPYALQVAIERDGIKTFKSMLQCLDRFGKELFLEANEQEVRVRPKVPLTLRSLQTPAVRRSLFAP